MAEKKVQYDQTINGWTPPSFPMKGMQLVSLTSASAQSAAFNGEIVLVSADVDFNIAWGTNPTATVLATGAATDSKAFCKATEWTEVHIADGDKVAGILSSGTGTMYIRYPKTQELG